MSELSTLKPSKVWSIFADICAVPHPSGHLEKITAFILQWAKNNNIEAKLDQADNIYLTKAATAGMENAPGVVLQAHLDMVPQKNAAVEHDFTKDPIDAYINGDWVTARDTTLGADNGIGMAMCLAVLVSDDIAHGPLEVLLTSDEETGMFGAFGLKNDLLKGKYLINTDSEDEGEVYIGCAGGVDATMSFNYTREALEKGSSFKVGVNGLRGGHSGGDIHLGFGNSNKILARFLSELNINWQLVEIEGGTLRNAIPREAHAIIHVADSDITALKDLVAKYQACIQDELNVVEKDVIFTLEAITTSLDAIANDVKERFINTLAVAPNGVERMSDEFDGIVETSLNLGIVATTDKSLTQSFLVRSLAEPSKERLMDSLRALAKLAQAKIEFSGSYPGWKPNHESKLVEKFISVYENRYNKKPKVMIVHAGLECGLFTKPYPEMDMISVGPTIMSPHSPDERVEIKTVAMFWQQLADLLASLK